jgi:hypothetical protein
MSPAILCLIFAATQPPDQDVQKAETVPDQRAVFDSLTNAVDGLLTGKPKVKNEDEREQLNQLWNDMRENLNILRGLRHQVPKEYRQSLLDNVVILRAVAGGKTEPEETLPLCQDVSNDLKIKAGYAPRPERPSAQPHARRPPPPISSR